MSSVTRVTAISCSTLLVVHVQPAGAERLEAEVAGPALAGRGRASRKQVPEFTSVVPPTALPSGSMIGGLPSVTVWPASRYSVAVMSRGRAVRADAVVVLALLEDGDAHARLGEHVGDGRAAGARADHAGVGADHALVGDVGAGDDHGS